MGGYAKRAKLEAAVAGTQRSMLQGVMDAVSSMEGLDDNCRRMLLAACPLGLGVAADERHELQQLAVSLLAEALSTSEAALLARLRVEETKVLELDAKRGELGKKVQDAEAYLEVKRSKAELKERELATAASALADSNRNVSLRQKLQADGDEPVKKLRAEAERLQQAVGLHLSTVLDAELSQDLKEHAVALASLTEELRLDDTLRTALPKSCSKAKAERGFFDNMVLEELQKVIVARISEINVKIGEETPGVTDRALHLEEAEKDAQRCLEHQRHCTELLAAAQDEQSLAIKEKDTAEKALKSFDEDAATAIGARDTARSELESFRSWPAECFAMLKDRTSRKTPAPASEAVTAGA